MLTTERSSINNSLAQVSLILPESMVFIFIVMLTRVMEFKDKQMNMAEEGQVEGPIKPDTVPKLVGNTLTLTMLGMFIALAVENTLWTHTITDNQYASGLGIYARLSPVDFIFVITLLGCAYFASQWGLDVLRGYIVRIMSGAVCAMVVAHIITARQGRALTQSHITVSMIVVYFIGYFVLGSGVDYIMREHMDPVVYKDQWEPKLRLPLTNSNVWMLVLPELAWIISLVLVIKYGVIQSVKEKMVSPVSVNTRVDSSLMYINPVVRSVPFLALIGLLGVGMTLLLADEDVGDSVNTGILVSEMIVTLLLILAFANYATGMTWGPDNANKIMLMVAFAISLIILTVTTTYYATTVVTWFLLLAVFVFLVYLVIGFLETFVRYQGNKTGWEIIQLRLSYALPAVTSVMVLGMFVFLFHAY